ncbi:MAG: TIR domain-containing protein [Tepidisphaerales bacterium]
MSTATSLSVRLVGPKADAVRHLKVLLERGRTLKGTQLVSRGHVEELRAKKDEWVADTVDLLRKIFDAPTVADSFADTGTRFASYPLEMPAAGDLFSEEMELRLSRLNVVLKRVEATPDVPASAATTPAPDLVTPPRVGSAPVSTATANATAPAAPTAPSMGDSKVNAKAILVVSHGVEPKHTEAVSEFLGRLGLSAKLHLREPGRPVELEGATSAGFAVMLMSAEDASHARPGSQQTLRSDIAFDMGFLCGRVGAARLAVLFPPGGDGFSCDRQIPYIPLDASGGWMLHLGRQMKRAGVDIDLNRVL